MALEEGNILLSCTINDILVYRDESDQITCVTVIRKAAYSGSFFTPFTKGYRNKDLSVFTAGYSLYNSVIIHLRPFTSYSKHFVPSS